MARKKHRKKQLEHSINFAMGELNTDYFETAQTSYTVARRFVFKGSDIEDVPTSIKTIVSEDGVSSSVRLYDATNAQVIAELAGFVESVPTIKDLGAISNVPVSEALLEIQVKKDSGGGSVRIYSFSMHF